MANKHQMRIFLVRHGQSAANVDHVITQNIPDHAIELSDLGHAQAKDAGQFLATYLREHNTGPVRVWNSPYTRTRQTAAHICEALEAHALPITKRESVLLCEQQFGLFDGIPDEDLPVKFPAEHAHYKKHEDFEGRFWARMPQGESRFDVVQRVHQFMGTLHRDFEQAPNLWRRLLALVGKPSGINNVVIVAHGVTNRAFIMQWMHNSFEWFEAEKNPLNTSIRLLDGGVDREYIYQPSKL